MKYWVTIGLFCAGLSCALLSTPLAAQAETQQHNADQNEAMTLPVDAQPLQIETQLGAKNFAVEIADNNEKRSRGLMYRTDFAVNRAMLFVFDDVQPVTMWMANTPLPLDMLFIREDGVIARIAAKTEPFSQDIISSGEEVRFVLEINAGVALMLGIKAGDRVRHPVICGQCN